MRYAAVATLLALTACGADDDAVPTTTTEVVTVESVCAELAAELTVIDMGIDTRSYTPVVGMIESADIDLAAVIDTCPDDAAAWVDYHAG
jgi:hypothetical protein